MPVKLMFGIRPFFYEIVFFIIYILYNMVVRHIEHRALIIFQRT